MIEIVEKYNKKGELYIQYRDTETKKFVKKEVYDAQQDLKSENPEIEQATKQFLESCDKVTDTPFANSEKITILGISFSKPSWW